MCVSFLIEFDCDSVNVAEKNVYCSRDCRFCLVEPPGGRKPYGGGVVSPEGYLLALWVHECRRVFADKLISTDDKAWVDSTIGELCKAEFASDLCKQVCRSACCEHVPIKRSPLLSSSSHI